MEIQSFPVVMNWAKHQILIFAVLFSELFENIDAETETGESPSKDSDPKTNATGPSRKRSNIVVLDDEKIEEFQRKQVAKNTVKGTDSAVCRLQARYDDRYGKTLELTSINKTNTSDLLKHFFLEIRDTRKNEFTRPKLKKV